MGRESPHARDGGGTSSPPSSGETITTTNHPPGIRTRLGALGLKPGAMVTATRTLTLSVLQTNGGSEAVTVQMTIQPVIMPAEGATATFTAL